MRYNNVKFIEPLAAAADALTARQAQEIGQQGVWYSTVTETNVDGHSMRRSPRHDG